MDNAFRCDNIWTFIFHQSSTFLKFELCVISCVTEGEMLVEEGVGYSLTDKFGYGLIVCASASVEAVGVYGAGTAD